MGRFRVVTFKLPDELIELVDTYAIKHGMSRSAVIRRALVEFLARNSDVFSGNIISVKKVKVR